jgi:hypothetical protein
MKVEIRPIDIKKWHKKQGKESFARNKKISALVGEDRKYATGLSERDIAYLKEEKGVKYNLDDTYLDDKPHEFWDSSTAVITLENKTIILDTDKPLDYIKLKLAKASKYIANSIKEYQEGLYPDATHVIYDENEDVEIKATKVATKKSAYLKCAEITKDKKTQIIMILTGKNLRNKSENFVEVELDNLIENKAREVLNLLEKNKEDLYLEAMILESLQKSVLTKAGHKIMYYDSILGTDISDVVEYFKQDVNQDIKLKILETLN